MSRLTHRAASLTVLGVLGAVALTGCGGGSSSTGSGRPSGFPSGRPGGFQLSATEQKKIQSCLKAAGIKSTFPSGRPSGFPSGRPSGFPSGRPSGSPPSGFPSGAPSGGFSGGPGGGFRDPQVQAALKACGITFNQPSGAPTPTAWG
jgi:hypothetical protein